MTNNLILKLAVGSVLLHAVACGSPVQVGAPTHQQSASAEPPATPPSEAPTAAPSAPSDSWRETIPPSAGETSVDVAAPEVATLKNGLTVMVVRVPSAQDVRLGLVLRAGASNEDLAHRGLAALTAQAAALSGDAATAAAWDARLRSLATTIDVSVEAEWTGFSARVLPEDVDAAASLLGALATGRSADKAVLVKARERISRTSKQRGATAGGRCWRALQTELLGKEAPEARDPYDATASPKVGLKDINAFRRHWYTPNSSALIVVGNVDLPAAVRVAEAAFNGWKPQSTPPAATTRLSANGGGSRVVIIDDANATQVLLCAGALADHSKRSLWPNISVANMLIGGDAGSRLNKRLRTERGLTYSIRSMLVTGPRTDLAWMLAAINRDSAGTAVSEALAIVGSVASAPPTPEELAAAKGLAQQQLIARYESTSLALTALMKNFGVSAPVQLDQETARLIPAVTPQAAVEAAVGLFPSDTTVFVLIGPSKALTEQLKQAGVTLPIATRP